MEKLCKKCERVLPLTCFGKAKREKDGLQYYCKECKSEDDRQYRERNKEKISHRRKKYREENEESIAVSKKNSYTKNKQHYLSKARSYYEKHAEEQKQNSRELYQLNREEIRLKEYVARRTQISKYLYRYAKNRASKLGLPFNLTYSDIIVPEYCPVFNIPLLVGEHKVHKGSPTLDRIIPELGYVVGNIQVISHLANTMKNSATTEELKTFAKWVNLVYDEDEVSS